MSGRVSSTAMTFIAPTLNGRPSSNRGRFIRTCVIRFARVWRNEFVSNDGWSFSQICATDFS
jgi:hypothetical protein